MKNVVKILNEYKGTETGINIWMASGSDSKTALGKVLEVDEANDCLIMKPLNSYVKSYATISLIRLIEVIGK